MSVLILVIIAIFLAVIEIVKDTIQISIQSNLSEFKSVSRDWFYLWIVYTVRVLVWIILIYYLMYKFK